MGKQLTLGDETKRTYTHEQMVIQKAIAENEKFADGLLIQQQKEKQQRAQARHEKKKADGSIDLFAVERIPVSPTQIALFL